MSKNLYFREIQKFKRLWLWLLIVLPFVGIFGYAFVYQIILKQPFGNNPAPDWLLIIFVIIFGLGLPLFFFSIKMITEVRDEAIYVKVFPFHLKFQKLYYAKIKSYEIRNYKPIREFGGWGIRYSLKGKAYNISGNIGLQITFSDNKKILLGTQKPDELKKAIDIAYSRITN